MSTIHAFCDQFDRPRTRMKAKPLTPLELALRDAKRRATSGDWEGAKGSAFVGLYAMCHVMVYGVVPSELETLALFHAAAKMAIRAQHELFHDDPTEVAAFVRWSWEREKRLNIWAQSKGIDRKRLSWRWQFSRTLETDYRVGRKR